MASARSAWGIDIGNRALKAVKLVREGDQLRVDDFEIIEHETVLSNSGDNRDSLIQSALAQFIQRHPLKGTPVAVAVSGQQSFARFIKLPPVEDKRIPEIVRFEAIQQIPFPLDDVEWSYHLFRSPDSPDVEVGIFAMRKELLAAHIKYFTDFDTNVQVVQLSPLAVYNAMYYDGRLRGTTMLIDLGAENTDLIIADEHSIWMRSIPIGGNNFTDTLVKAFKLNFAKAEDLKRNAATSKYARQIFQAMRPVFADLVAEIQRSVGFYSSVHRDSRIKKCLAIGGTFKLPGLQKYLQQNLNLDVERLDTIIAAPAADSKVAPNFNENVLSLVTAYGLGVQAMDQAKVTSSLLPQKIRREKEWKEKTKWFAAAAALFVVGTGISAGSWWLHNLKYDGAAEVRTRIDSIKSEAQRLDTAWDAIQSAGGPERTRIQNVRSMEQFRSVWGQLMADIYKALPTPQPQVLDANPEVVKQVPRAERRQIVIDNLQAVYMPSLAGVLSGDLSQFATAAGVAAPTGGVGFSPMSPPPPPMPGAGGEFGAGGGEFGGGAPPPPVDPTAAPDPNAPRGFLVRAVVITPNDKGAELVQETLIRNLMAIGPTAERPKVPYSIPKAKIITAKRLRSDEPRLSKIRSDFEAARNKGQGLIQGGQFGGGAPAGGGAFGGGGEFGPVGGQFGGGASPWGGGGAFGGGGAVAQDDPAPFADRKTGEDIRDDWMFDVIFVVQLDPPPPAPKGGDGASASADTPG